MLATYIYSKSCQCSCFSSGQGSQDHIPVHPSHPERTGEGLAYRQTKLQCLLQQKDHQHVTSAVTSR